VSARQLVNGTPGDLVSIDDRGFNYGDGAFETMLVAQGAPIWWEAHVERLRRAGDALGIALPAPGKLRDDALRLTRGEQRATLKLVVTRGPSRRGYRADPTAAPTIAISLHAAPMVSADDARLGLRVRRCAMTLAAQPRLAGLKHLNRLEQVLARAEWTDDSVQEGLMCDVDGRPICATAANLFLGVRGRLVTPLLDRCGVAGIARAWVLARGDVETRAVAWSELETADELFLSSSVRGILPIARLDGQQRSAGPMTRELQAALWSEQPAFIPAGCEQ
jgi:4-amino-4-deoxychorismate lyase